MSKQSKNLTSLVSAALVASAFGVTAAHADINPFAATTIGNTVQIAGMEGQCGEGKCGSGTSDKSHDGAEKDGEGKCGEGKCGGEMKGEGSEKDGEGKCGEGKCGSE